MWAKILLFATVIYTGVRVARFFARYLGTGPSLQTHSCADECAAGLNEMVKDPVCGLYIATNDGLSAIRSGTRYWFCSEECRLKFLQKEG